MMRTLYGKMSPDKVCQTILGVIPLGQHVNACHRHPTQVKSNPTLFVTSCRAMSSSPVTSTYEKEHHRADAPATLRKPPLLKSVPAACLPAGSGVLQGTHLESCRVIMLPANSSFSDRGSTRGPRVVMLSLRARVPTCRAQGSRQQQPPEITRQDKDTTSQL